MATTFDSAIYRQIALLWQTRPLRREKLFVTDEIENARAYMQEVFLTALPKLYAGWEKGAGGTAAGFCPARHLDRRRP